MVFVEKSFPRGGVRKEKRAAEEFELNAETTKNKPREIFGAVALPKPKKPKLQKKEREALRGEKSQTTASHSIEAFSAELLTIGTLKEDMVIMGCVKEINHTSLQIALPGRINGNVDVSCISDSYTCAANRFISDEQEKTVATKCSDGNDNGPNETEETDYEPLSQLFYVGQIVCTKVSSIVVKNSLATVALSLLPRDIHGEILHSNILKGSILSVAIKERSEHGYVLETGVNNLRAFLPNSKVQDQKLKVGGLYFCKVKSIESTESVSTATFELTLHSSERKLKETDAPNLDLVLPGTLVSFKVAKILKDGLQGSMFNGKLNGYINEHQLGFISDSRKIARPKSFQAGTVLSARILYVMPLTKLVYLSLYTNDSYVVNSSDEPESVLPIGTIVPNAKVSHIGTGGVVLRLGDNRAKGVISMRSLKKHITGNFDQEEILVKFSPESTHEVRIMYYDPIDLLYICTNRAEDLKQKYFTPADVNVGDFVEAKVVRRLKDERYELSIGAIKAYIEPNYLSTSSQASTLKVKSSLKCRIVSKSVCRTHVYLTNRKEFMDESASILIDFDSAQKNSKYIGLVKEHVDDVWIIDFFNHVRGKIFRQNLKPTELIASDGLTKSSIHEFVVTGKRTMKNGRNSLLLGISGFEVKVGNVENGKVTQVNENGMEVALIDCNQNGFVPIMYLSDYPRLVHGMHRAFKGNENVKVVGVSSAFYSLRDVKSPMKWSKLLPGDIITAFIKDVAADVIKVQCLIPTSTTDRTEIIHYEMFLESIDRSDDINLVPDQKIYVKVLARDDTTRALTLSAQLRDVWCGNLSETTKFFQQYFDDIEFIKNSLAKSAHPICKYNVGDIVNARSIEDTDRHEICKMLIDDKVNAILTPANRMSKMGSKDHEMLIIWIDYVNCVVYGTVRSAFLDRAKQKQKDKKAPSEIIALNQIKTDLLLVLDDLIVLYPRKHTNQFIYVPTRLHYNDFQTVIKKGVREGQTVNVKVLDSTKENFIGIFGRLYRLYQNTFPLKAEAMKRTATEMIEIKAEEAADINEFGNDSAPPEKKKVKKHNFVRGAPIKSGKKKIDQEIIPQFDGIADSNFSTDESEDESSVVPRQTLPGVSNFWSQDFNALDKGARTDASSDDDSSSDADDSSATNRKKLSPNERFEKARDEEAGIRQIEKSYADNSAMPNTVDQFDRWLMAEPNNSRAWIHYIAFHVQATEIDQARAIAKKALKTINFRESQELLNIWAAMLNLEVRFGSADAFNEVLKEALHLNEPFKIYAICLQIYADCKRVTELCDLISTITRKFRQQPECWIKAAQAYFQIELPEKAKSLLTRALQSLPEREHISTIVSFSNLCNRFNDKNHAHALMEQILTSYPKRTDCWSQYVDMLVKSNDIDSARQTLERAVSQKIPMKKMRTVFKKYVDFEQKYGNDDSVAKVKALAANYVESIVNS